MLALLFLVTLVETFTTAAPAVLKSLAAATKDCDHKLFDEPWMLTGITMYNPTVPPVSINNPAWLRFNFIDYNDRLRLETVCYANLSTSTTTMNQTSVQTVPEGYYIVCADDWVQFKLLGGGLLMAARSYVDRW